jgi:t-SNARE complex subunit (syntaxin)
MGNNVVSVGPEVRMSEAMTRLEQVDADVEKAQAALATVEGVLHTAVKVQATGRAGRKLLRPMTFVVVVGAVVAVVVFVVVPRRRAQLEARERDSTNP